ncbi:transmembrane protease serine 11A-like [Spea bombifrons]|uniref:transmembrane protease serine 11A-like n=1 Tax=Spea bombifrons TaxID=233779 RepID=UPI00234A59BC|nr:transmembrane protease serine 11A-like [Spea bombifrons]
MKFSEHWKIKVAVISLVIVIIAAVALIVLFTVFVHGSNNLVSSANLRYYEGSFRILNLNYTDSYQQSNSVDFLSLSEKIQSLLAKTFEDSELKSQFNMSKVTNLKPGSVIAEFVLLLNENAETKVLSPDLVQQILLANLKTISVPYFDIDVNSVHLSEIPVTAAQSLLISGVDNTAVNNDIQISTTSAFSVTKSTTDTGTTTVTTARSFEDCGIGGPPTSGRIVGGTDASLGSWPWQASLRYKGYHTCGASLISSTWLVSAAHCFERYKTLTLWTVILGTIYSTSGSGLNVENIIVHENYTPGMFANDIALLKLSDPVTLTSVIWPVCLPDKSAVFPDDASCYITGWGAVKEGGSASSVLQQAVVKVIGTAKCSSAQMYGSQIVPSMICAGYVDGQIDSCQGDSGGPLVTKRLNGTWVLVGSVSFGYGCAEPNKPGVYSRTTYLRSWIKEKCGV